MSAPPQETPNTGPLTTRERLAIWALIADALANGEQFVLVDRVRLARLLAQAGDR